MQIITKSGLLIEPFFGGSCVALFSHATLVLKALRALCMEYVMPFFFATHYGLIIYMPETPKKSVISKMEMTANEYKKLESYKFDSNSFLKLSSYKMEMSNDSKKLRSYKFDSSSYVKLSSYK